MHRPMDKGMMVDGPPTPGMPPPTIEERPRQKGERMTRQEAEDIAIEALDYVVNFDTQFLMEDTINRYEEALRILSKPKRYGRA